MDDYTTQITEDIAAAVVRALIVGDELAGLDPFRRARGGGDGGELIADAEELTAALVATYARLAPDVVTSSRRPACAEYVTNVNAIDRHFNDAPLPAKAIIRQAAVKAADNERGNRYA